MFHLPIGHPQKYDKCISRASRGYEYNLLSFSQPECFDDSNADANNNYTVICDPSSHTHIFAYVPPRQTETTSQFIQNYAERDCVEIREALEGTLITFFWNAFTGEWDICTRNGVGGNYSFVRPVASLFPGDKSNMLVSPKSYREMVFDCVSPSVARDLINDNFTNIPGFQELNQHFTYTCVLQHCDNHLVYHVSENRMVLLAIHGIARVLSETGELCYSAVAACSENGYPDIWRTAKQVFDAKSTHPLQFVDTLSRLNNIVENAQGFVEAPISVIDLTERSASRFFPPAWILKNMRTQQYTEIQNPYYANAKAVRNLQPNLRYQWLNLMKTGQIETYLSAFPIYRQQFNHFQLEYYEFIVNVHNTYVQYYVKKNREVQPKRFFVPAAGLHHNVYLPSLTAGAKQIISVQVVKDYLESLATGKLYHYIATST